MQVAIDTSTDVASLALIKHHLVLAEMTWHANLNHTIQLLPNLEQIFKLTGTRASQLTGIAVAIGPGSFSGLRVGVSTAKGLAFSLNIPIVGINSLEIAAYQYKETRLPVCAIFNAGHSELVSGIYQEVHGTWVSLAENKITTLDALCSQIKEKTLFCGEFGPQITSELKVRLRDKAIVTSPLTNLRRAGFLAELGLKRLESDDVDNVANLQPLYLRRPPITQTKKL